MEGASAYVYDESGAHVPVGDDGEDVDHAAGSLDGPDAEGAAWASLSDDDEQ